MSSQDFIELLKEYSLLVCKYSGLFHEEFHETAYEYDDEYRRRD